MVMKADANHYDRTSPWEALGADVRDASSIAQVIKRAGMDFEVGTIVPVVNGIPQEDFRAIHRLDTDSTFGFAKKGYTPVQYRDAFSFLDGLEGFTLESAGTVKGGSRAFIQARLDRDIEIEGDRLASYFTICTSHDGSMGLKFVLGTLRLDCTNQFPILGASGTSWSHRHSTNVMANAKVAVAHLTQANEAIDTFEEEVRRLMETEITDRKFQAIMARVLPINDDQTPRQRGNVEEAREGVRAMYASAQDGGSFAGSGWGVVNAFNSWNQWVKPVKSTSDRAERQVVKTMDGTFGDLTRRVADLVLA